MTELHPPVRLAPGRTPRLQAAQKAGKAFFARRGRQGRLMMAFVYVPTLLVALYLALFYSNMYISESYFALRNNDGSELPAIASVLFPNSSNTILDAYIVQKYISSMDMMEKVDERINLHAHYADRSRDPYSRLWAHPTKEEMLKYWQWIVTPTFDPDKGIIVVEVKAYTPEMAKAVNDAILASSEELVNQMNDRAHQDAIRLTRTEVENAEKRLLAAQDALRHFRDAKSILDPQSTAAGLESVVTKLEAEAAGLEAELTAALQVLHENNPRVLTLKNRIQALREQLITEKARLAGLTGEGGALSSLVGDYTHLMTEVEFAQQQLLKSMAALEGARLKSIAQSRYIVPFQPPTLPEESLYPRPVLFTLFTFFALLIALGIISLIIAAIKDHMGV